MRARAWQAAIAACSAYGPSAPPSASARSSAAQPAPDQQPVPARAVLVEQQDGLAVGPDARPRPRGLQLHQRDEPVHLGLARRQLGEDAAEAQRLLAQRRPHPVVARGRRVALVEDQVDDLEHRGSRSGSSVAARAPRTARAPRRACAWPARSAGRPSPPRRGRRARSPASSARRAAAASARPAPRSTAPGGRRRTPGASRSSPTWSSIAASRSGCHRGQLRARGRAPRVLRSSTLAAAQRSIARCLAVAISQAPGLSGTPARPLLQRRDERVLREVLGQPDVAHHPRQPGDQPGRLDPPDGVDRAVVAALIASRSSAPAAPRRVARRRSSCSRSSGVSSSPKSSASNTGRISISTLARRIGLGQRLTHSTASSIDLTCHSQ